MSEVNKRQHALTSIDVVKERSGRSRTWVETPDTVNRNVINYGRSSNVAPRPAKKREYFARGVQNH
jgi:hypothetical protein